MRKYKYSIIIGIEAIIIILVTTLVIYNIKNSNTEEGARVVEENTNKEVKEYNNSITTNNVEEEKISPNAIIIFTKYYKECKHTAVNRENVTNEMVNLNEDEFKKLYSDWKIKKFARNEIELYKEFDGQCGEHYIVKDNNGYIAIYKIRKDGVIDLIKDTEISTQYLPDIDLSKIKQGVKLIGDEELNAYLENFE